MKCSVTGCTNEKHVSSGRGMCRPHYSRWKKYGDPLGGGKYLPNRVQRKYCKEETCSLVSYAKEYCYRHYRQFIRKGHCKAYINKGYINEKGYKIINIPGHPNARKDGSIQQHRYVMSEYLGRSLYMDEIVHHKNGNRVDNRIENLELWTKSHPCGQRVEDKLLWANEIIQTYLGYINPTKNAAQVSSANN